LQRLHGRPRTVRGAAGLEHPFWFDQAKSLPLSRSLRSNKFDAFRIRKLRQIGVSDFAPTFSLAMHMNGIFNRSKNTVVHILELYIASLGHPSS
jgi:hypothetical protein